MIFLLQIENHEFLYKWIPRGWMKIQAIDLLQLFKVCCLDYFFVSIGPIMPWKFEIFSPSFSLRNFWKVVSDSFELVSEFLGRWKSNGLSGLSAGDISAFTKYSLFFLKSYKFIFTERATGYILQNPVGGSFFAGITRSKI